MSDRIPFYKGEWGIFMNLEKKDYNYKQALFALKDEYIRLEKEMQKLNNYINYGEICVPDKKLIYLNHLDELHLQISYIRDIERRDFVDINLLEEIEKKYLYSDKTLFEITDMDKFKEQINVVMNDKFRKELLRKRFKLDYRGHSLAVSNNSLGQFSCYLTNSGSFYDSRHTVYIYPTNNEFKVEAINERFTVDDFYELMNTPISKPYLCNLPDYYIGLLDKYEDKDIVVDENQPFQKESYRSISTTFDIKEDKNKIFLKAKRQ